MHEAERETGREDAPSALTGGRVALRGTFASSGWIAVFAVAVALGLSWASVYLAGGVDSLVPHLYYVPIVFAAVRFGPLGALLVALIAGWLAGPLSYVAVAEAIPQSPARWLTRLAFFVGIGQLMAWLVRPTLPSLMQEIQRLRDDREIRAGLKTGQFVLCYEPIIAVRDGALSGFEALVRWQHPQRGMLPPAAFLPAIESSKLLREFDEYVLRSACDQAATWLRTCPPVLRTGWFVSVNLSADEFADAALPELVSAILQECDLPAERLCVEITERTLMEDTAIPQLERLKGRGVRIAIDDFGTGYSSLVYLSRFPADILKLDRALVARLETDPAAKTLARGVTLLAESFGMQILAEGVETPAQRDIVAGLEFDLAQGYHFTKPLAADEVPRWLRGRAEAA